MTDSAHRDGDPDGSTGIEYFDRMYQVPDPWGYETSWYERRKYDITLAALPRTRYRRAFEPGCSIGVLTARLADRCDELDAADFHGPSVARARRRVQARSHVTIEQYAVPARWPAGSYDLVVISEVAYYLDDTNLDRLVDRAAESLEPDGEAVLVHWRGATDYPQSGDDVHDRWRRDPRFVGLVHHVEDDFRLDVLRRSGASR